MIRLLIALLVIITILLVLIAYGKIRINNPAIEYTIRHIVMSIPGTPKTPRFIIESTASKFSKTTRYNYTISLASGYKANSDFDNIGLNVNGNLDYSNPNSIKATGSINISDSLKLEFKEKDQKFYFKINKISDSTQVTLRIDPNKISSVLENWMVVNTNNKERLDKINYYSQQLFTALLEHSDLNTIILDEEKLDGVSTYLLQINPTDQSVEQSENQDTKDGDIKVQAQNTSPWIKNIKLQVNIEKGNYNLRKIKLNYEPINNNIADKYTFITSIYQIFDFLKLVTNSPYLTLPYIPDAPVTIPINKSSRYTTLEILFKTFGKQFEVLSPTSTMSPVEYYGLFVARAYVFENLPPSGRDSRRLGDLSLINSIIQQAINRDGSSDEKVLCHGQQFPCVGNSLTDGDLADGRGWIKVNLSNPPIASTSALPIDPINNKDYHYLYCAYAGKWEVNAKLESGEYKYRMRSDAGDDPQMFEVGNTLKLIGIVSPCTY